MGIDVFARQGCDVSVQAEPLGLGGSLGLLDIRPTTQSPVVGADASNEVMPVANITYCLSEHFALNPTAGLFLQQGGPDFDGFGDFKADTGPILKTGSSYTLIKE